MGGSTARAAMVVTLLASLAACGVEAPTQTAATIDPSQSPTPAAPTPTVGSSPTLDPEQAAAAEEILAVYHGFRAVEDALNAHPVEPDAARERLSAYVVEPLLSRINWNVYNLHLHEFARAGEATSEPVVTDLRLADRPAAATIRDCLDTTEWQLVDRASRAPVAGDEVVGLYAAEPGRHVRVITVVEYSTGWRLEDATWQPEQTC